MTIRLKKKSGVALILLFLVIASSMAYSAANVANTKHNLSYLATITAGNMNRYFTQYNEVCVYCHTPHNANSDTSAPLWNRNMPTGSYNMYTSSTMDSTMDSSPAGVSLACLSCHDGTIAVDSIINPPNSGWTSSPFHASMMQGGGCALCHDGGLSSDHTQAYLIEESGGTSLSNDHPISMTYPTPAQDPDFFASADVVAAGLRLYSGKVECPTCHEPHDNAYVPFLRKSNADSALCFTCHDK